MRGPDYGDSSRHAPHPLFLLPVLASADVAPATLPDDKIPSLHLKRKYPLVPGNTPATSPAPILRSSADRDIWNGLQGQQCPSHWCWKRLDWSRGLHSGSAHVVITTSRYSHKTVKYYQASSRRMTTEAPRSPLFLPTKDRNKTPMPWLISTLNLGLDYIFPFAAIPEIGARLTVPATSRNSPTASCS